jgi:hypothetical protein
MRAVVRGWMWVSGPKGGRDGERRIAGCGGNILTGGKSQELDRNPLGWPYIWPQHRHFSPTSITATTIKCFLGHARCQFLSCLPANFLRPRFADSLEPGPLNSRGRPSLLVIPQLLPLALVLGHLPIARFNLEISPQATTIVSADPSCSRSAIGYVTSFHIWRCWPFLSPRPRALL